MDVCNAKNEGIKNVTKVRNSNLELFRIISMLLIVAHHYVVNSGLTAADGPLYANSLSWQSLFLFIFGAWGKIGINCFVLITGYFMCKSNITLKKYVKLVFEVLFYKVVIYLIFLISGYSSFSLKSFVKMILLVPGIGQNFTGCFLVFFLCIPFLNILIKNMNEKMHIRLLLIFSFAYVLMGTFPFIYADMNYVSWFAVLYLISSYVRLYPKKIFTNTRLWGFSALFFVLISIVSVFCCAWLGEKIGRNMAFFFVTDSNTFLAVATGFSAFMFFNNLKIKNSKFINTVAASTFGVLLIHANSDTMRAWLWGDLLDNVSMYGSRYLVVHAVVSVIVVFAVCTTIDYLRIRFVEKPFFVLWDKHFYKIGIWYKKTESTICKKLNITED